MRSTSKYLILIVVVLIFTTSDLFAQCAMCRATLENNVSNGNIGIAEKINYGILYLFAMPYLAVMVIGYLWYKKSKANEQIESNYMGMRHVKAAMDAVGVWIQKYWEG